MTATELIPLVASIASLVLAVVAIWLSIMFFKLSSKLSESTHEAAKGIGSSVERLEKLFDKLYSDTFSMMRDTVTDMRKHIWPTDETEADKTVEEAERRADEKISELKKAFEQQLSEMLERQKLADSKVSSVRHEMRQLLDQAIVSSRQAESEAREETIREHILRELRVLRRRRPVTTLRDIVEVLPFSPHRVFTELERLQKDNVVSLSSNKLDPNTEIRLLRIGESRDEG